MEKIREKREKFEKLISDLDSKIICGANVAIKIQDSHLFISLEKFGKSDDKFRYKIGTFNKKDVMVDPHIIWEDLRIFDENNIELINLSNFGFETEDLI